MNIRKISISGNLMHFRLKLDPLDHLHKLILFFSQFLIFFPNPLQLLFHFILPFYFLLKFLNKSVLVNNFPFKVFLFLFQKANPNFFFPQFLSDSSQLLDPVLIQFIIAQLEILLFNMLHLEDFILDLSLNRF